MGEKRQDLTKMRTKVQKGTTTRREQSFNFQIENVTKQVWKFARERRLSVIYYLQYHTEGHAPCIEDNMNSVARLPMIA